jgi:tetratricopeptide (TPR) repeat protein
MAWRGLAKYDAAILHFQKALELDSSMWEARDGEAQCYIRRGTTQDYKTAVELDKMTVNELEKIRADATLTEIERQSSLHSCLERLGATLVELNELDEALETYERAFSNSNRCNKCICALLDRYQVAKRHEDIMKLFRSLNSLIEGLNYTRMSESLLTEGNCRFNKGYFQVFAQAALTTDELPFAFEMYRNAITAARRLHKPVQAAQLELCLASLYDRYSHDSERAARMWEKVLETYRSNIKAETQIAEAKRAASICLARYCVKRSVEVGKDSSEAERCGAILQRLSKVRAGSQVTIAASESTTMLGAWYKLMGRDEEADACFRVQVKESIRMLSDDDPTNDKEAYRNLAMVLAAAGDDKTAIGLVWEDYGFIKNNSSEEDNSESNDKVMGTQEQVEQAKIENYVGVEAKDDTVDSIAVDDRLRLNAVCDGCFRKSSNSFAKCRYCHVVDFCQDCFTLLKAGELKVNVCSPKHSWLIMESRSKKELKAKEPGSLWIDGQNVTIDELKKRLAAQWKI